MKTKKEYVIIGLLTVLVLILGIYLLIPKGEKQEKSSDVRPIVSEQPRAAITPQGTITFCFRLNGQEDMHLPALLGAAGDNIYPNGLSGYNWSLTPTSTGDEPYGVLKDGTIFIKKDFLKRWNPNLVELKSDLTGWAPIKLTLDQVNGEPAYVYRR